MRAEFGSKPEDVLAAIGPGIGKCCYEVGIEVAQQLGQTTAGRVDLAEHNRRRFVGWYLLGSDASTAPLQA